MLNIVTLDAQTLCATYGITEVSHGLSLYLQNLARGKSMTPPSWLYEHRDPQKVLHEWIERMEKANSRSPYSKEFCSFDLKQVEKFGPQGGIPPINSEKCVEVVEPLYTPSQYDDPLALEGWFQKAHEFGKALFCHPLRGRPLAPESVVEDMKRRDTLTTNSGFPRFHKRRLDVELEVQDAKTLKAYDYPAVILFRYYYGKLRPVWMFPMAMNLNEAGYQVPIQRDIARSPLIAPLRAAQYVTPWSGFEYVKEVLTEQWKSSESKLVLGGDTTKMDAHMRPAQLRLVYEIVKWYFQEKYWAGLQRSLMHVTDIDLLWSKSDDDYQIVKGVHGLASGSCWTQITETVLQLFMAYAKGVKSGQGIGDDFYWMSDMSADELVEYLSEFGLPANPAKQSVSEEHLTFLQRYYRKGFFSREHNKVLGAYYPTIRALGSMIYPEKFHKPELWSSDMFCVRCFMIAENCVDDPCFSEFVKFVVSGQKDLIPFAKRVVADHAFARRVQNAARQIPGLWPSYNQEKLDKPLWSFVSIGLAA